MRWSTKPIITALIIFSLTFASLLLPNPMEDVLNARAAIKASAAQEAERMQELQAEVSNSQELTPEQRQELVRQLEEISTLLRQNPGDLEKALADLSRFEEQARNQIDPNLASQQAYLEALAARLAQLAEQKPGSDAAETADKALEELLKDVEGMDDVDRQKLSRDLAQLSAQASQSGASQLSQALASLTQALQSDDSDSISQAARQAQAALAQLQNQLDHQAQLQKVLAQAQSSRQALAATGRQVARSSGASGSQQRPGAANAPGQGSQPGSGGGANVNQLPPAAGGQVNVRPQGHAPSTTATSLDSQVYAPWQRSSANGEQLFIPGQETEEGETITREGQNPNPGLTNPALIPYSQVYFQYLNAANQAMQQDYVPFTLRDYVRQYFSSLEPR